MYNSTLFSDFFVHSFRGSSGVLRLCEIVNIEETIMFVVVVYEQNVFLMWMKHLVKCFLRKRPQMKMIYGLVMIESFV